MSKCFLLKRDVPLHYVKSLYEFMRGGFEVFGTGHQGEEYSNEPTGLEVIHYTG
jgi:hypothetical protein